jgi:phosphate transport system permease protein
MKEKNDKASPEHKQHEKERRRDRRHTALLWIDACFVMAVLLFIIGFVFARGAKNVTWGFLTGSDFETGIAPQLFNTIYILVISMVPLLFIGISAAIYTVEYARKGVLLNILRFANETLTSIPSIVVGFLGFLLFVTNFGVGARWEFSRLAGGLTLAVLNLPWMMRTAEDALHAVPDSIREASLALGATKMQTVLRMVLPAALPNLVTGALIVSGRIIGETAALIYTSGVAGSSSGWFNLALTHVPGDTLAVHIYTLFADNPTPAAQKSQTATAVVLIALILVLNLIARMIEKRLGHRFSGN